MFDMTGNSLAGLGSPFPVTTGAFTSDVTPPTVTDVVINVNRSIVIVNFDEPVNVSSIAYDSMFALGVSAFGGASTTFHRLRGGSTASSNGLQVVIGLTEDDLNVIKRETGVWSDNTTAYVGVRSSFITDMNDNAVVESVTLASVFVEDVTSPELVSFDLDMNSGVLSMTFSETVNVSS